MLKQLYKISLMLSVILLAGCATPGVIEMQHVNPPQMKLPTFGAIQIQAFTDSRPNNLQYPQDLIPYQEILKSDNLSSEFLQKSEGVGSSTWYYDSDPEVSVFMQSLMQQVGLQSGFINPKSNKHYLIEGTIYDVSIQYVQTQDMVNVHVKFTGVLRKDNGVMLMIMPINYNYTQAMFKPLPDKSKTTQLTIILDRALTAAVLHMYQMIEMNFPAKMPSAQTVPVTNSQTANSNKVKSS